MNKVSTLSFDCTQGEEAIIIIGFNHDFTSVLHLHS
jgi:hypothetical protein